MNKTYVMSKAGLMDIVWLIEKLEKAIEILSWKETYIFNSRALRIKREFLKELE